MGGKCKILQKIANRGKETRRWVGVRAGDWGVEKLAFANFRENLQKRRKVIRGYMRVGVGGWWVVFANIGKICKNLQKVKKELMEHTHSLQWVRVVVR